MASHISKIKKDPFNYVNSLSVDQIEKIITFAADKYYNTKKPVISDAIYDMLIDFLKLKNSKSKVLKEIGSTIKGKNKTKLPYPLASMDKIKPPSNKLEKWIVDYKGPYFLSDKLDGVSGLIVYTYDKKINFYTRGTSTTGLDISKLIKYISNIPSWNRMKKWSDKNKIKGKDNIIAFRGELIIKKSVFKKNWSDKMKNARNTVSGLVNSKKYNPLLANNTNFVVYEVVDPYFNIETQYKIIKAVKMDCVQFKKISSLSYENLGIYLKERRKNSEYDIDGIIINNNDLHKRSTTKNPKYAWAFKDILEDQIAEINVIDIEWNISKDGYIKPVLILEKTCLGGVEIQRVTAYNAKYIIDNKLGPGAKIKLVRSGDVIPKILEILKKSKNIVMPKYEWKWHKGKVDIILKDKNSSPDVIRKNIYYFFSKLNTSGMGEKTVEKMISSGLNTIEKILKADKNDFLKIDGFKDKSATNLFQNIKKATTNVDLNIIMAGSNKFGRGLGEKKIKLILSQYPNILIDGVKWKKEEMINNISEIDGFDSITSTYFSENFTSFLKFWNDIKKHISINNVSKKQNNGKIVVMTGFRDTELKIQIEKLGGTVNDSFSSKTNILIIKNKDILENPTSKIKKAIKLKINILTFDEIKKIIDSKNKNYFKK